MNERDYLDRVIKTVDDAEIRASEQRGCSVQGALYLKALHDIAKMSITRADGMDKLQGDPPVVESAFQRLRKRLRIP